MWYSLLLTLFNHTGNNTACYVAQFIIELTSIIQKTTQHVMWYSLLLTHFNHTGNNTACYVVQFIIIDSL